MIHSIHDSANVGPKKEADDDLTCICCTESLTLYNVVNTKCNHRVCSQCYYKWTESHNSCVFCRQPLYEGNHHEEYIQLGKDLNTRREVIVDLSEEAWNLECENSELAESCGLKMEILESLNNKIVNMEDWVYKHRESVKQIRIWKLDPIAAIKMWEMDQKYELKLARENIMKKIRHCLDEMCKGGIDHSGYYVNYNQILKKKNHAYYKKARRRLNMDGAYDDSSNYIGITPFIRSSLLDNKTGTIDDDYSESFEKLFNTNSVLSNHQNDDDCLYIYSKLSKIKSNYIGISANTFGLISNSTLSNNLS